MHPGDDAAPGIDRPQRLQHPAHRPDRLRGFPRSSWRLAGTALGVEWSRSRLGTSSASAPACRSTICWAAPPGNASASTPMAGRVAPRSTQRVECGFGKVKAMGFTCRRSSIRSPACGGPMSIAGTQEISRSTTSARCAKRWGPISNWPDRGASPGFAPAHATCIGHRSGRARHRLVSRSCACSARRSTLAAEVRRCGSKGPDRHWRGDLHQGSGFKCLQKARRRHSEPRHPRRRRHHRDVLHIAAMKGSLRRRIAGAAQLQ